MRRLDSWEKALGSFGERLGGKNKVVDPEGMRDGGVDAEEEEDDEDEDDDPNAGSERLVMLVEGPKRVGKSSFAKVLLNRLLSQCVSFLLGLQLDPVRSD